MVQFSKSVSLSAFDKNIQNPHTNFSVKVLENGQWKEPIVDIIDREIRFFISPYTDSIVAYTDTSFYWLKLNYKQLFPATSKQFFLTKPDEKTLPIKSYEVPYHLLTDTYALVPYNNVIQRNSEGTTTKHDIPLDNYLSKYPKLTKVLLMNNQYGIYTKELNSREKKQLLQEIKSDSLIAFAGHVFTFSFSSNPVYCDNHIYLDVDGNKLNKCRRAIQKLGFDFAKNESGEVDYWHIVYN